MSNVSVHQVSQALESFIKGKTLSFLHIKESRTGIPIRLIVPREHRITPNMLATAFVKNNKGKAIPLSRLITIIEGEQAHPILHQDMERVVYIGGELNNSAPVYAVLALEKTLDGMDISNTEHDDKTLTTTNLGFVPVKPYTIDGYKLHWSGELRLTLDAFRDMGIALGLSLLVIYY